MTDTPAPHTKAEDATALITGLVLVSLGLTLHASAQILIGGTMGMALLAHYASGIDLALAIALFNLPFYALALWQLGWRIAVRTAVAVTLLSGLVKLTPAWLPLGAVQPVYAAVAGGLLIGWGSSSCSATRSASARQPARHPRAGAAGGLAGGLGAARGDAAVLAVALLYVPPDRVALSLVAAFAMNVVLALNHRKGRYVGAS